MKAEAPTLPVDATPTETNGAPPQPVYYAGCPFCRVTLPIFPGLGQAPIYGGLHTRWLGNAVKTLDVAAVGQLDMEIQVEMECERERWV